MVEEAIRIVNMYAHPILAKVVTAFMKKKLHRVRDMFINYVHYKLLRHASVKRLKRIYISQNYVGLVFEFKDNYLYIMGVDGGKVFVNIMDASRFASSDYRDYRFADGIAIMTYEDYCFFNAMEYHNDCIVENITTLPWPNNPDFYPRWYRIQGDVVLGIMADGEAAHHEYINSLMFDIYDSIATIIHRELAYRIQSVLSDHGITSEFMADSSQGVIRFKGPKTFKREHLAKLARLIVDEVFIEDIDESVREPSVSWNFRGITVRPAMDTTITIAYDRHPMFEHYPFYRITVHVGIDVVRAFAESAVKYFKPEVKERTINHGRHTIRFNGYPTSVVIEWEPPFKVTHAPTPMIIPVRPRRLYIDVGELKVSHPEHGENTYSIVKPLAAMVGSTHSNEVFEARSNAWAIKLLPVEPLWPEDTVEWP